MVSNPEAVQKLQGYNMWQSFLVSCSIKVGLIKLTAFNIMHSILRHKLQRPQVSSFMLNTPAIEFNCHEFQVQKPSKLISFGFFLPLKGMPHIRVFKVEEFED